MESRGKKGTRDSTWRKAELFDEGPRGTRICHLCERYCKIKPGGVGFCKTRRNQGGVLYTLVYGNLSALESRPIEIKPFFHFYPGSTALTYSTWSCNLRCPWCQNYTLSMMEPREFNKRFVPPDEIIKIAKMNKDRGICVSFNEPTLLFEHMLDTFPSAKDARLYTCIVSNGYMTERALRALWAAGLDAARFDIKGGEEVYKTYLTGARYRVVWRNAHLAKALGMHVEMINLVVRDVNDSKQGIRSLIRHHLTEVGPETPLHFTRFYPQYKFHLSHPTSVAILEWARETARADGVLFPYIGNVQGHQGENTFCPRCGELLIERKGYRVVQYRLRPGARCCGCGCDIPIVGEYKEER